MLACTFAAGVCVGIALGFPRIPSFKLPDYSPSPDPPPRPPISPARAARQMQNLAARDIRLALVEKERRAGVEKERQRILAERIGTEEEKRRRLASVDSP